jgi:DNA primase
VVERDTLKLMLQRPELFARQPAWNGITPEDFLHPAYAAVGAAIMAHPDVTAPNWVQTVLRSLPEGGLREWSIQLAVDPVLPDSTNLHAREYAAKLQLLAVQRRIAALKSTMQRTNPVTDQARYEAMFQSMVTLELRRKELLQITLGDS